jgi:hypothetical protein
MTWALLVLIAGSVGLAIVGSTRERREEQHREALPVPEDREAWPTESSAGRSWVERQSTPVRGEDL